jgi:DNA transposition AAA+ family ATPase
MAHNASLPPTDRDDAPEQKKPAVKTYPCKTALRDKLRELRDSAGSIWSNSTLGNKLGYSSAVLSRYLSEDGCKYDGNISGLETKIEDFLKAMAERRASGIETSPSKIADEINTAFDYIRKNNQIGVIVAESGAGKSRGTELILEHNPLAIFINVTEWNNSKHGIMSAIWHACPHDGYDRSMPQFPWLVTKMRSSDRPFLFDNAHKLGRDALSLVVNFLDDIKCPGGLLGLNILVEKLVADLTSQSTSRVGVHWPVKISPKTDKKLLSHMIRSLCKDINGELDDVVDLCQQVADHHGHFRAVEQRLKGAAELRRSNACETWTEAFRLAHQRSLHPCQLT